MSNTQAHKEFASRMDLVEGYASNPKRTGEEQRYMVNTVKELQSCGYTDIKARALRLLQYIDFEVAIDLIEGFASNPKRKAEDYKDMIPTAEKLLSCGFADIEQRAQQIIQELRRQSNKKWWRFWK